MDIYIYIYIGNDALPPLIMKRFCIEIEQLIKQNRFLIICWIQSACNVMRVINNCLSPLNPNILQIQSAGIIPRCMYVCIILIKLISFEQTSVLLLVLVIIILGSRSPNDGN